MQEPPIRKAINVTLDAISARASSYRNLVILVSTGALAVLFLTIWQRNLAILLLLCWSIPLVSLWLLRDSHRLGQWQERVAAICSEGKLDLTVFCSTIRHLKYLPQNTLEGMLECLIASTNDDENASDNTVKPGKQSMEVKRCFVVFGLSSVGCLIVTASLFLNLWYSIIGIAICLSSPKISLWWTKLTNAGDLRTQVASRK